MNPAVTETLKTTAPYISLLTDFFKGAKDEVTDFFEIGVSEYIEDKNSKISQTNTFIKRTEKVNFYDVYFPLNLTCSGKEINSDNLLQGVFSNGNCSSVLGIAGSGKTMLVKHAFLQCYEKQFGIPILIELRDLNTLGVSLLDFIYLVILKNKIKPNTKIVERALKEGGFVFLFDGFDEINLELKEKIVIEIEQFVDYYHKNKFIISSRPGAGVETLPRFRCYFVQPLNQKQIIAFIRKQLLTSEDNELINKLIKTVNENTDYIEYLRNPLLLSMYILTYRNYPELPKSKNKFYWNVFDTLCTKHDSISKKGAYAHQKKTALQNEDFETILKWFCYISNLEDKYTFDEQYLSEKLKFIKQALKFNFDIQDLIYDLTVSVSILIVEGLDYKFPHRTIQDYFMVLFIKDQNEETKEIIYNKKFNEVIQILSNRNLFELCIELDKESYYKFYLIPLFEEFYNRFNKQTLLDNMFVIFKEAESRCRIIIGNRKITISALSRRVFNYIDIGDMYGIKFNLFIDYEGEYSQDSIVQKLLTYKRINAVSGSKNTYDLKTDKLEENELKSFILEFVPIEKFKPKFDLMYNQLLLLKDELKENQHTKQSLIDFVITSNKN